MRILTSYAHHSQTFHIEKILKLITSWLANKDVLGENEGIIQVAAFTNYLSLYIYICTMMSLGKCCSQKRQ